ncbi:hypothetical protein QTO34_017048 [Cnephaeus nilssonii]|uniref:Biogenesis of lysosome-related organelles complex 1 subunit 7 n=1 Tax=Cnephaeus nilssonii TaxID=3371016 RepID=A0AA40I0A5_CNENI|nr:hypothetical protein QTO34_017048 [Eptesicus nilssonii]
MADGRSTGHNLFVEGLLEFLQLALQQLDSHSHIHGVRERQVELQEQIDNLCTKLCHINVGQKVALDLYSYVVKLLNDLNAQEQAVSVNNILQNAQEPLRPITTVLPRKQPKKGQCWIQKLTILVSKQQARR